jgi:hypothetical protein
MRGYKYSAHSRTGLLPKAVDQISIFVASTLPVLIWILNVAMHTNMHTRSGRSKVVCGVVVVSGLLQIASKQQQQQNSIMTYHQDKEHD